MVVVVVLVYLVMENGVGLGLSGKTVFFYDREWKERECEVMTKERWLTLV